MNALQITEAKAQNLNELEDLAMETLRDALKDTINADDPKVKVASAVLSVVGKNRQTTAHSRGIEYAMARETLTAEELKKYRQATTPQIQKALAGK